MGHCKKRLFLPVNYLALPVKALSTPGSWVNFDTWDMIVLLRFLFRIGYVNNCFIISRTRECRQSTNPDYNHPILSILAMFAQAV